MKIHLTRKQTPKDGMAELKARLTDPANLLGEGNVKRKPHSLRNGLLLLAGSFLVIGVGSSLGERLAHSDANNVRAKRFADSLKVEPPLVAPRRWWGDEKTPVTLTISISDTFVVATTHITGGVLVHSAVDTQTADYTFTLGLRDPNKEDDAMEAILANGGTIVDIRGVGHGQGQRSRPGSLMGL